MWDVTLYVNLIKEERRRDSDSKLALTAENKAIIESFLEEYTLLEHIARDNLFVPHLLSLVATHQNDKACKLLLQESGEYRRALVMHDVGEERDRVLASLIANTDFKVAFTQLINTEQRDLPSEQVCQVKEILVDEIAKALSMIPADLRAAGFFVSAGGTTLSKLKTTQNLNQQNNAEILCKNDYALSF